MYLHAAVGSVKAKTAKVEAPSEEDHDQALAELEKVTDGKAKLEGVARLAEQAQPKGSTLDSAGVHTPVSTTPCMQATSMGPAARPIDSSLQ